MGTFEVHCEHLTVPWVDPSLLSTQTTTHDDINTRLTIEDSSPDIGDRRVQYGRTFEFNGSRWIQIEEA